MCTDREELKIAIVEWVDSFCEYGWQDKGDIDSAYPEMSRSVGFIFEKPDWVVLIQSDGSSGNVLNITCIPRVSIKSITYCVKENA